MDTPRHFYSLADAAKIAKCRPADLLHCAVQGKLKLLVGVPDSIVIRVYDDTTGSDIEPFLTVPQLLAVTQSPCLRVELNGRTAESDFPEGYCIDSSGKLTRILPNFGYRQLIPHRSYWRTFLNSSVQPIELTPAILFVQRSDLDRLREPAVDTVAKNTTEPIGKMEQRKVEAPLIAATLPAAVDVVETKHQEASEPPATVTTDKLAAVVSPGNEAQIATENTREKNVSILRLKQVLARTGLSRSTVYDKINRHSPRFDPSFPKQVHLGASSVGWYESDIVAWLESRERPTSVRN
jgi:predicted DNA-binding transcriptional regulator AlpA